MIIETVLNLIKFLLTTIFGVLPSIPNLPDTLLNSIDSFFNIIFSNVSLLSLFVRINTLKIVFPILLVILNFDKIYKFTMWVIKKLPFSID